MIQQKSLLIIVLSLLVNGALSADTLYIVDGSRLQGRIVTIENDKVEIDTAFAGKVQVNRSKVKGLVTEASRKIVLSSGDTVVGMLAYDEKAGQSIKGTLFGDVPLQADIEVLALDGDAGIIRNVKAKEEALAREQVKTEKLLEKQQDYETHIAKLEARQKKLSDPWSGAISLGINGADGNTDRLGIQGRGELNRKSELDRLKLYVQGDLQRQNGATTDNEVLAGASLERDISKRWFAYGRADFEKDDFENLDLRGVVTMGVGYYLVRSTNFEWKGLAGVGYQHETYTDGTSQGEGVVSLGYDLSYNLQDWLKLVHDLTYFPSLTSPASDYRLVSNTMGELPIGQSANWKLRIGLRNQYDALPRLGARKMDTTYLFNMVYDWD